MRYTMLALFATLLLWSSGCKKIEWKTFTSEKGGFKVLGPGTMKYKPHKAKTAVGTVTIHTYMKQLGSRVFMAAYGDYPSKFIRLANPKKLLDGAAKGSLRRFKKAKILSKKPITQGKVPGVALHAQGVRKNVKLEFNGKFFLKDNRLYQIIVIQEKGLSRKPVDKYLQSFQLTGLKPASRDKAPAKAKERKAPTKERKEPADKNDKAPAKERKEPADK